MVQPSVFPLRLRDPQLRAYVREVAARDRVSQNELIEQAVANEVVIRGGLIAAELVTMAARLTELGDRARAGLIQRSIQDFADGEGRPDPIEAAAYRGSKASSPVGAALSPDRLGVIAAFHAG